MAQHDRRTGVLFEHIQKMLAFGPGMVRGVPSTSFRSRIDRLEIQPRSQYDVRMIQSGPANPIMIACRLPSFASRCALGFLVLAYAAADLRSSFAQSISGSGAHVLSLQSGRICGAGENEYGQLGDGTAIDRPRPVFAAGVRNAKSISTNDGHSLAATEDGSVWAWGLNRYGQLGDGTTISKFTPVQVPGLSGIVSVATGQWHSLALSSDGSVWGWGYNGNGQVGDGSRVNQSVPVRVLGIDGAVAIAAGAEFSVALRSDGTVWSWGLNNRGQLGDGSSISKASAVQVSNVRGVSAIAAGTEHAVALLRTDGSVWAWGSGAWGQLGGANSNDQLLPVRSGNLVGLVAIAAGNQFTIAARQDGTVWSWGRNSAGQLGDRTTTARSSPVQNTSVRDVRSVAAGEDFSVAVRADGSRVAWGGNAHGQLGTGSTSGSLTPVNWLGCSPDPPPTGGAAGLSPGLLSAGGSHALSIRSGAVCSVGSNDNGQLGDGTSIDRWRPVLAALVRDAAFVSTNEAHSLAVTGDGSVWSWGINTYGRLGDGGTISKRTPIKLAGIGDTVAVAAGRYHSLALKNDGSVWAWGYNGNGQLGDGTRTGSPIPVRVVGLDDVIAIAAGNEFSMALRRDSTVWTWGQNNAGQLGDGTYAPRTSPVQVSGLSGVSAVAAGGDHAVVIKGADGSVWTWGAGSFGQLGYGGGSEQPSQVRAGNLVGITAVAAGQNFSVAVRSDGTVWAWGRNQSGQLGDRSTSNRIAPVQAEIRDVVAVVAGGAFTAAIKSDGSRWIWGSNDMGQFGNGATTNSLAPVTWAGCAEGAALPVSSRIQFPVLAAAENHTLAVRADRVVWGWGANSFGQLGDGTSTERRTPVQAAGIDSVRTVSTSERHSLAVKEDGTVWSWGSNQYGQLGDGSTNQRLSPVRVPGLTSVVAAAAGGYHSLALKSDGTVWSWGYAGNGQLGDGSTSSKAVPIQVLGLAGVVAIAAGEEHSLALKGDGSVWAWGYNSNGELGNGTYQRSTFPTQVAGLVDVLKIAAGSHHSLAIRKSDGSVWTWGAGSFGQLGEGGSADRPDLGRAGDLTGIVAIAGGTRFSLAVKFDGTVWAWGENTSGQLGDRSTVNRAVPVKTDTLNTAVDVAAGARHGLALLTDGRVWVWGANASGQFARPSPPPSSTVPIEAGEGFYACSCLAGLQPPEPPKITSVRPNSVPAGSGDTQISILGSGFTSDSAVRWNQTALTTTFVSPRELRATVGRSLLVAAGRADLAVALAGTRSNTVGFLVSVPAQPKQPVSGLASIEPKTLSYPTTASEMAGGTQDELFRIANNGEEPLRYAVEVVKGETWLSLVGSGNVAVLKLEGTIAAKTDVGIPVRATFNRLTRPQEEGIVRVSYGPPPQASFEINVAAASPNKPEILLSRTKIEFLVTQDDLRRGDILAAQFHILNLGPAALQWEVLPSKDWISVNERFAGPAGLSPFSDRVSGAPPVQALAGRVNLAELVRTELKGDIPRAQGSYTGALAVRDLNRSDVPVKRIEVEVKVVPPGGKVLAEVYPTGFLFTGDVGEKLSARELTVQSFASSDVAFTLLPSPLWQTVFGDSCGSGGCITRLGTTNLEQRTKKFSIEPRNLPASDPEVVAPVPAQMNISFNVQGATSVPASQGGNWLVEGLVVRRGAAGPRKAALTGAGLGRAAEGCETSLHIVSASLPNNFYALRTAAQQIELKIADGCGTLFDQGTVLGFPSNGDPAIRFRPAGAGSWQGLWQPARIGQAPERVRIEIVASSLLGAVGRRAIDGTVLRGAESAPTSPVIANAASRAHEGVVVPGSAIAITGTDFLDRDGSFRATAFPLPLTLAGVSVFLGEQRLPLLSAARISVSDGSTPADQIEAIVPFELSPGEHLRLTVERNGQKSAPVELMLVRARPGIFVSGPYGGIVDQSGESVTESARAAAGTPIRFHATGLGPVTAAPLPAAAAPAEPLSTVTGTVKVLFNGVEQAPDFAGLAPGLAGIYRVDVVIPESVKSDTGFVEMVLEADGVRSNPVSVPVI